MNKLTVRLFPTFPAIQDRLTDVCLCVADLLCQGRIATELHWHL